jgi:hypothetical protein
MFAMRTARNKGLPILSDMVKILKFFTDEDYNSVIDIHGEHFFALPDIKGFSTRSVLDLAKHVRAVTNISTLVSRVPPGIRVLQCEGSCLTLQEVLA